MKTILSLILASQVLFAAELNMNKTMKEMKESLKCLTKNASFLSSCKSDLEEIAKMRQNISLCSQASKAYYLKLYNDKLTSQVPNDGDIKKAFDGVLEQLGNLETAIKEKNSQAQSIALNKITEAVKKSHDQYKPELD